LPKKLFTIDGAFFLPGVPDDNEKATCQVREKSDLARLSHFDASFGHQEL